MAVLVLALVAAFAPPLRQGCGTACVEPSAAHARVEIAAPQPAGCHKPAPPPEPVPAQDYCSHDHNGSLRASARATVDAQAGQWVIVAALAPLDSFARASAVAIAPHDSQGSPPFLRNTPLRV